MIKTKLIIVDSNSLFCAGYFGLKKYPLSNKDGVQTGGIYAFLSMFSNIIKNQKPDHVIFTFDTATSKNKNKELLGDYKGNRDSKPEDFIYQLNKIRELLPKLGFDVFESKKYEADDVIATMVNRHYDNYDEILIQTGDTDMYQLIDEKVRIIKSDKVFGLKEFYEKLGSEDFLPESYVLYKSIVGDNSDNICGVDRIGPKTALKILIEGSFNKNEVYEHEKIKDFVNIIERNIKVIGLKNDIIDEDMCIFKGITDSKFIKNELEYLGINKVSECNLVLGEKYKPVGLSIYQIGDIDNNAKNDNTKKNELSKIKNTEHRNQISMF